MADYGHSRLIKKIDLADQAGKSSAKMPEKECREVAIYVPRIFDSVVSWHSRSIFPV